MRTLPLASAPWRFRDATRRSAWRRAAVPGCVHTDLRHHQLIPDPFYDRNELQLQWIEEHDWEYRCTFTVPATLLAEEQIELVADGLDTLATVTLNGHAIGRGENMFVQHRWAAAHLRSGPNELLIRFDSAARHLRTHRLEHQPREFNDPVGRCSTLRKQQCQFGWDWGPRLVTAGIWKDLRLEAWTGPRLESVRVTQEHHPAGAVTLHLAPEFARPVRSALCRWRLTLGEVPVAEGTGPTLPIAFPQLWWPAGQGAQPLYLLQIEVTDATGRPLGHWSRRLGLRTLRLDRQPDAAGETFRFVVNGRPLFAKGANWIPAHSFVAQLTRADYVRDLRSAVEAHMNMIRVWGGGIYEHEAFYDLCDELGLLVWQDFMFACTLYPSDHAFQASVRTEATQQVRRLRHRACLALWCGNNEIAQLNTTTLLHQPRARAAYEAIFHRALPAAVRQHDGVTDYWPSSQWRGDLASSNADPATPADHAEGEKRGDTHFWDVWHARHPVSAYEKWRFRFVSEFGMQSYSSPATNATFCPPGADNVFGATMENHQKNRAGNQIILDYVSRRYRFPRGQDELIYLSQLNQAHCMQVGVEHYRRLMPHCMGALYWQLNDCWPVASWSSIEFTGRWRALHHHARRFFAPLLVSAHVPGGDTTIGNYRRSDVRHVHLHTVCDAPTPVAGLLRWDLFHLDGRRRLHGQKKVRLRPGEAMRQRTLDLARPIARHGLDHLVLRLALDAATTPGEPPRLVSQDSVFLTAPRFLELPRGRTFTLDGLLSSFNTLGQAASVAGVVLLSLVAHRFPKKGLFITLFALQIANYTAYLFLQPGQLGLIFTLEIVGSFFGAPLPVLMWAMYADTADYGEWQSGRRTTALVFSASTMSQKFGWALAAFLAFQLLQFVGFQANVIPSDAVQGSLVRLMSIYPALLGLVSIVIFLFYPLTEQRMAGINADLAARRLAASTP